MAAQTASVSYMLRLIFYGCAWKRPLPTPSLTCKGGDATGSRSGLISLTSTLYSGSLRIFLNLNPKSSRLVFWDGTGRVQSWRV